MALKRKRQWWLQALRGLVLLIFGLFCLFNSTMTLEALMTVAGAFVLGIGVVLLTGLGLAKTVGNNFATVEAIIDVIIGLIILINPIGAAEVIVIVVAIWAIIMGAIQILAALRLREYSILWSIPLSTGILTFILGILLIANPFEGAQAVVILVGLFSLIAGIGIMAKSASKDRIEVE